MILILVICIFIEVLWAKSKINQKISPSPNYFIRGLCGVGMVIVWHFTRGFDWVDLFALVLMGFSWYWTFFDGFLNLARGLNWFYIGQTKWFDKIWRFHTGTIVLQHFIKWCLIIGTFQHFFIK